MTAPTHPELLEFMMSQIVDGSTNLNLDADQVDSLPTTKVNLHLTAECNFFRGNFQQPSNDSGDINSNVTVNQDAILNAVYKRARTAAILPVGINFCGSDEINDAVGNSANPLGDVANLEDAENSAVGKDILDVISLTLFKRTKKYAAIRNDHTLVDTVTNNTKNVLSNGFISEDSDYAGSKFFPRYLDSGRYDASTASEANGAKIDYNFNQARLHFVVTVNGSLADADGEISNQLNNAVDRNEDALYMARALPSRLQNMIGNTGDYHFNVLFTLVQNDKLGDGEFQ